jgi:small subunit ribosomal protein S1
MDRAEIAAMLDAFAPARRGTGLRQGQRVRGVITRLTPSLAFVGVGGKADASIDRMDLEADVTVGSEVQAYVVSTKDGEIRLARTLGGDDTRALLDDAVEQRIPIQGRVESRNEHGFVVALSGGVRGFCPAAQIDHAPEADLDAYVGRTLTFRVLDVRGREAVVSHRAIAEIEAKEAADRALAQIKEGEIFDGTVTGIREFGAFVRIAPGLEGLVRLPNLARRRVTDVATAVQEGQAVRVKVLSIDLPRRRLDLGIRQVEEGDSPGVERSARKEELTTGGSFGTFGALLGGVKVPTKRR